MEKIKRIWFDSENIFMESNRRRKYSRHLADFPRLLNASEEQRNAYEIDPDGEALRWEDIDEDIHISSFYETKEAMNEVANIFYNFPMLNVSEVAAYMGINKSMLSNYIYGIKKPSAQRLAEIKNALHEIGKRLTMV